MPDLFGLLLRHGKNACGFSSPLKARLNRNPAAIKPFIDRRPFRGGID